MIVLWSLLICVVAYTSWRVYRISRILQAFKHIPKLYVLGDPFSAFGGYVIPKSRWNPGALVTWNNSDTLYTSRRTETVLLISLMNGDPALLVSSPEACKDVLSDPVSWVKPGNALGFNIMGANVIASNPPVWRTHRKIAAPAFDNKAFIDEWQVVVQSYHQMMASAEWKSADHHFFPASNDFTTRIALLAIARSGFDIPLQWEQDKPGLATSIENTMITVSHHMVERLFIPQWILGRVPSLKPIKAAFEHLEKYLVESIATKKAELAKEAQLNGAVSHTNKNVFGRFVAASQKEGAQGLEDRDVVGNLFAFLLAGYKHETTAHTLLVTLAMLAFHQKDQERVAAHIRSVIGNSDPTYDDYNALLPVLHCFYEAVRLFPAGWVTMRLSEADELLTAPHLTPTGNDIAVPKGTVVVIDVIGGCRNPRHFPSPDLYVPLRWAASEDPNAPPPPSMDTFLGFSSGPRTCLGKKFASVEAVAFLSLLLRDWRVDVKLADGDSPEAWCKRVLAPILTTSFKTGDVPLMFTRRLKV